MANFVIRGTNWWSEKCKGGALMCQGQIGEKCPFLAQGHWVFFCSSPILLYFTLKATFSG